jgi:chemotaxis protein CheX
MTGIVTAPLVEPDDVRVVTTEVWTSFLAHHEPLERSAAPLTADEVVRASVAIRGTWDGVVTLEMPPAVARTAAQRMLADDTVDQADVLDALGELVNMIGGNIKSLLPSGAALGLPTVTTTPVPTATPAAQGHEHCRVDLTWADATIAVRLWSNATDKEDTTP